MDSLGNTAVLVALKGRAAVFKPKVQSGFQRFSSSVIDVQVCSLSFILIVILILILFRLR